MIQWYVCDSCKMSIFIQSSNVKEGVFCVLYMLRIHTGLRKWNKKNRYHILLCDKNLMGINQPCIKIANSEVLSENIEWILSKTKMPLKFKKDDAIKCNQ